MVMRTILTITLLAALAVPASAQATRPDGRVPSGPRPAAGVERRTDAETRAREARAQRGRGEPVQTDQTKRTVHLGADAELDLANVAGDIVISRAAGAETLIEVTKTARAGSDDDARELLRLVQVDITERGNRVEVRTQYPGGDQMRRLGRRSFNVTVQLAVTTPAATRIRAQSVAGSVLVKDITGEVSAESVSGDVRIANAGPVSSAKSISGSVEITGATIDRPVQLSTVSGSVVLRQVKAAQINAGAISGDVVLEDVTCPRVKVQTVSGDVRFSGAVPPGGRYELGSHSGSLHLSVGGGTGFQVNATSFSGAVRSDFPITLQSGAQGGRRHQALRGVHGDGSAFFSLTTFSGSITISKR